ncbi:MAG: hypothetical protein CMM80_05445 [Rhodospirillaceae bacterium]|nr:hypothetical protein [Rhodospirillaceae bacterium]|tara:strand:- start:154 stop:663 length:510 start_codon:yes stop_codon:yes gene_type:complete
MSFVNTTMRKTLLFHLLAVYLCLSACSLNAIGEVKQLTESHLRKIDIVESQSRNEQLFRQTLEQRIGTTDTDKRYQLSYRLTGANQSSLSAAGSSSTLNNTKMSVNYSLEDNETGNQLTHGSISATATSGSITSHYGKDVSAKFAAERLVGLLAERTYQKLQLYFLSAE